MHRRHLEIHSKTGEVDALGGIAGSVSELLGDVSAEVRLHMSPDSLPVRDAEQFRDRRCAQVLGVLRRNQLERWQRQRR